MAKTTVDTLLVKIEADMGNLKKELNKVSKQVSNTDKKTKKAFAGIGLNFRTLVTGAVGLGTIAVTISPAHLIPSISPASQIHFWTCFASTSFPPPLMAGEIVTMALNSGQDEGNEGAEENPTT